MKHCNKSKKAYIFLLHKFDQIEYVYMLHAYTISSYIRWLDPMRIHKTVYTVLLKGK